LHCFAALPERSSSSSLAVASITGVAPPLLKDNVRLSVCGEKNDGTPNIGDHRLLVLQRTSSITEAIAKAQGKLKLKKKPKSLGVIDGGAVVQWLSDLARVPDDTVVCASVLGIGKGRTALAHIDVHGSATQAQILQPADLQLQSQPQSEDIVTAIDTTDGLAAAHSDTLPSPPPSGAAQLRNAHRYAHNIFMCTSSASAPLILVRYYFNRQHCPNCRRRECCAVKTQSCLQADCLRAQQYRRSNTLCR
jgi:hypothetical protein